MCNLRSLEAMEQGSGERAGDAGSQAGELRPWITVGVPSPSLDMREAQPGGCEDGSGSGLMAGKTGWPAQPLMQDDNRKLFRWFSSKPDARRLVRESAARILAERERK